MDGTRNIFLFAENAAAVGLLLMWEICALLFTQLLAKLKQLNPIFLSDICSVYLLIIIWEADLQSDNFQYVKHLHSISAYLT